MDFGSAAFNDDSFCYIPWEIRTEEEGLAFIEAYKKLDLNDRDNDLVIEINGEQRVLPRVKLSQYVIREGRNEREPNIPLVVEWPDHAHIHGTVWYSNGYGRLMNVGDGFPMTEEFIAGLREIASFDKPIPEWKIR